ncbi:hypothetical protein [Ktedonospora formicarum]|uniref:Uncharacterized protein n=1 Tax=Ktedonospora formicarum TaxID=2778364 RepID=A0A8J3IGQ1_9CHLR|nr:hypothetical protein [Ktedonospora formicarum]GHO51514.1 hypothetical protein KSX_96770 [Ktedonospora formicarum]
MQITPEMVTRWYAQQAYDIATARYEAENGPSLVEQNADDFIADCDLAGIQSEGDDSERYIDEQDAWGISIG